MATSTTTRRTSRAKKDTALTVVPEPTEPAQAAPPEPYLLQLDPRELLAHPSNPRRDYGDLTELRQTIAGQGVLQALTVIPDGHGHRVVAGHRRAAAAAEALDAGQWPPGLPPTVPCVVRPDLADVPAEQIISMLVENDHRKDLTLSERAAGYAQLALFDVPPEEIARRTGRPVADITASIKLHRLGGTYAAHADRGHLTLTDVAALEEFDGDPKAVARILKGALTSYGIAHHIDKERRKRKEDAAVEKIRAELKAAGVKEVPQPKGWPYNCAAAEVRNLVDGNGEPVDWDKVKHLDFFGTMIERGYTVRAVNVCLNPKAHGLRRVGHTSYRDPEEEAAKAEAERAWQVRASQLGDARKIRERFLVETYGNAKATKVLLVEALRMAVIAPGLLNEGDPDLVGALAGGDPADAAEAKQDRLIRLLVARWVATEEDNLDRLGRKGMGTWRTDEARGVAWLDRLTAAGYELSEAETSLRGDLIAAVAKAEAARQANIAAQRAREEAARQAVDEDGQDEPAPSQFVLYYLTHDDVWVLSDDDSGQPVGELTADADAVEQAKTWAAETIAGYGCAVAGWRTEHDTDAAADYYVAELAAAEPADGGAAEDRHDDPDAGQAQQPAGDGESAAEVAGDGGDVEAGVQETPKG